jgi:hypothetical protein
MIEFLRRRTFERKDLAALWIDSRHDMFNGAVFSGGIQGLKNQQQRPLILGVQLVLQFREHLDAAGQRVFGSLFVLRFQLQRVSGVDVFEPKLAAVRYAERIGESPGAFDDFFCFHVSKNSVPLCDLSAFVVSSARMFHHRGTKIAQRHGEIFVGVSLHHACQPPPKAL